MKKSVFVIGIAATGLLGVWAGCSTTVPATGTTSGGGGDFTVSNGVGNGTTNSTTNGTTANGTTNASVSNNATTGTGLGGAGNGGSGAGGDMPISVTCNPVTNAGCTNGDACDTLADMNSGDLIGFQCWPGPNTVADCASCDPMLQTPPFCSPGSTCFTSNQAGTMGQCGHYCCTDADCGANGQCAMTNNNMPLYAPISTMLGVCVTAQGAGGGGGGGGGGAGGGSASMFACNAPATSPSNGSCVTLTP